MNFREQRNRSGQALLAQLWRTALKAELKRVNDPRGSFFNDIDKDFERGFLPPKLKNWRYCNKCLVVDYCGLIPLDNDEIRRYRDLPSLVDVGCTSCLGQSCSSCARLFPPPTVTPDLRSPWPTESNRRFKIGLCSLCARRLEAIESESTVPSEVTLYSKNFAGRTKIQRDKSVTIHTEWYKDKDSAEERIKSIASALQRSEVAQVEYHKATQQEDRYKFTVFLFSGIIAAEQ
jgi:hypothetical protein